VTCSRALGRLVKSDSLVSPPRWFTRSRLKAAFVLSASALTLSMALAQAPRVPNIRVAILGNPVHQVMWTDEALEKLKSMGFNEVQMNIGWGTRPFGEPESLIEVVTVPGERELPGTGRRQAELQRRLTMAKQHGLRTLFLFGSPFMGRNPYLGDVPGIPYRVDDVTFSSWYDVMNPKVRDHELALLKELRTKAPDLDDILVYTYDADAWQTPEFQDDSFSYGKPLADRLPGYIASLHRVWTEGRSGKVKMWWEPWELSAGQVYAIVPKLPRTDFGLMIHSNIAEAQLALPVDAWFRNTARICSDLGIPVVAEGFFASATEEIEPLAIPAPRLVDEEYLAFTQVPGVVGIKEYYGINTDVSDLDLDLLQARFHQLPSSPQSTEQLLTTITSRFGAAAPEVRAYLELLAEALQIYPWDASWRAREVGRASVDHGWRGAAILGSVASTPSWEATRHARFMKTDDAQPQFWMLEDIQLRCQVTAGAFDKAASVFPHLRESLADPLNPNRGQFDDIEKDVDTFRHVARSYALHLRETNVTQMLRQDLAAGRPLTSALVKELGDLLDVDVANQSNSGRVLEMRRLYRENPEAFVRRYLIPVNPPNSKEPYSVDLPPTDVRPPERGYFSLTTR
jgi:hypothetical protein